MDCDLPKDVQELSGEVLGQDVQVPVKDVDVEIQDATLNIVVNQIVGDYS